MSSSTYHWLSHFYDVRYNCKGKADYNRDENLTAIARKGPEPYPFILLFGSSLKYYGLDISCLPFPSRRIQQPFPIISMVRRLARTVYEKYHATTARRCQTLKAKRS